MREWLEKLRAAGLVRDIYDEVSSELEAAHISYIEVKKPHPKVLFFHNISGKKYPLVTNLFGSFEALEVILGGKPDEIAAKIERFLKPKTPRTWGEKLDFLAQIVSLKNVPPKRQNGRGECQQVRGLSLRDLPILRTWEGDGGAFITMGQVYTRELVGGGANCGGENGADCATSFGAENGANSNLTPPAAPATKTASTALQSRAKTTPAAIQSAATNPTPATPPRSQILRGEHHYGNQNLGMYRLQFFSDESEFGGRLGLHWQIHKDAAHFWHEYARAGVRMPVSVAIGGDPLYIWCGQAPLPKGVFELLLYGFIRGQNARLVRSLTNDIFIPRDADFVIEGYVDGVRDEGRFGDHTGFYTPVEPFPVMKITQITSKREPIFAATVVGKPPLEDKFMGHATERIFLPMFRVGGGGGDLLDYKMPENGVFHNLILAKFRARYPAQAQQLMHAFWGVGQMSFVKHAVFLPEFVDGGAGGAAGAGSVGAGGAGAANSNLDGVGVENDVANSNLAGGGAGGAGTAGGGAGRVATPPLADFAAVARFVLGRFSPRALMFSSGVCDQLDHASPNACFGGKLGLDATQDFAPTPPKPCADLLGALRGAVAAANWGANGAEENGAENAGENLRGNCVNSNLDESRAENLDENRAKNRTENRAAIPEILEVREHFADTPNPLVFVKLRKNAHTARQVWDALAAAEAVFKIIVFFDEDARLDNLYMCVWRAVNNIDALRDVFVRGERVGVDATSKGAGEGYAREWPAMTDCTREVVERLVARGLVEADWEMFERFEIFG